MEWLSEKDLDEAFDMKAALSGVEAVYERIIGAVDAVTGNVHGEHDHRSATGRRAEE
jgi:hypothetical protein